MLNDRDSTVLMNHLCHQADIVHQTILSNEVEKAEYNLLVLLRPKLSKDGNQYCLLYGENLQEGIAGFGDTPYLAMLDFNKQWHKKSEG